MTKNPNRFWIVVLLLGWAFDFLFWKHPNGVNFPIFMTLCLVAGLFLLLSNGLRPNWKSLLLVIPFGFFAAVTFIRKEPLTIFLAYTFTFFSLAVIALTYLGGRWFQYGLADYGNKVLLLVGGIMFRGIEFINKLRKEQAESESAESKLPIRPILRGILIALPIVACFATLLASADVVFNQRIADFFDLFSFEKITEYIFRLGLILIVAYSLAGVFLHAAVKSKDEKLTGEDKPLVKPFLGFTETIIVLGSVTALFLMFVSIQFQYFFGGQVNIGVEGFTYSEYARRGFNELVIVAFLSLLLILGLSTVSRRENTNQRRIYSGLSIAIVLQVLVILVSAFQRLMLGIDWHGFSRLRLYPSVFLVWVGILFVVVVVLEIVSRQRYFAFAAVLASMGFAVSLTVLNVDATIVRHNVVRATEGKHFNFFHLASLSSDAVPALVDEYIYSHAISDETREALGAALLCFQQTSTYENLWEEDWRSFSLSQQEARDALDEVEIYLTIFSVNDEKWPVRVRTPSDELYECKD